MDLQATSTGDLAIVNGELAFVAGQAAIVQAIGFALRTGLAESRHNRAAGVPWIQIIFQVGTPDYAIKAILEQSILAVDGVLGVKLDTPALDRAARVLTVTGSATTVDGDVTIAVSVEV